MFDHAMRRVIGRCARWLGVGVGLALSAGGPVCAQFDPGEHPPLSVAGSLPVASGPLGSEHRAEPYLGVSDSLEFRLSLAPASPLRGAGAALGGQAVAGVRAVTPRGPQRFIEALHARAGAPLQAPNLAGPALLAPLSIADHAALMGFSAVHMTIWRDQNPGSLARGAARGVAALGQPGVKVASPNAGARGADPDAPCHTLIQCLVLLASAPHPATEPVPMRVVVLTPAPDDPPTRGDVMRDLSYGPDISRAGLQIILAGFAVPEEPDNRPPAGRDPVLIDAAGSQDTAVWTLLHAQRSGQISIVLNADAPDGGLRAADAAAYGASIVFLHPEAARRMPAGL